MIRARRAWRRSSARSPWNWAERARSPRPLAHGGRWRPATRAQQEMNIITLRIVDDGLWNSRLGRSVTVSKRVHGGRVLSRAVRTAGLVVAAVGRGGGLMALANAGSATGSAAGRFVFPGER